MVKLIDKKKKTGTAEVEELRGLWDRALLWVEEKPRQVAGAAGGGALLVLLLLSAFFLIGKAEKKRVNSVSAAVSEYVETEGVPGEEVTRRLRTLADRYSKSELGGQARYFLAGSQAGQGDLEGAEKSYRKVIEDFSGNATLSSAATVGLGYVYRLMGENEKARETFEALLQDDETPLPRSQIYMELGLAYEALGMKKEALTTYRKFLDSYPESSLRRRAQQKVASLEGA